MEAQLGVIKDGAPFGVHQIGLQNGVKI